MRRTITTTDFPDVMRKLGVAFPKGTTSVEISVTSALQVVVTVEEGNRKDSSK